MKNLLFIISFICLLFTNSITAAENIPTEKPTTDFVEGISTVYEDGKELINTVYSDGKEIVSTVYPDIKDSLKSIAKSLGVAVEHVWGVLVKNM